MLCSCTYMLHCHISTISNIFQYSPTIFNQFQNTFTAIICASVSVFGFPLPDCGAILLRRTSPACWSVPFAVFLVVHLLHPDRIAQHAQVERPGPVRMVHVHRGHLPREQTIIFWKLIKVSKSFKKFKEVSKSVIFQEILWNWDFAARSRPCQTNYIAPNPANMVSEFFSGRNMPNLRFLTIL